MALSENLVKRLLHAVGDQALGRELVNAIDSSTSLQSQLGAKILAGVIVATNVSQTVDFGSLLVGDQVVMLPNAAVAADQVVAPIAVAGDLGQAAVVGNVYLVFRSFVTPSASAIKL